MSIGTYPPTSQSLTVPLPIAQGGTGGDDAAEARNNLGCGTMAQQDAASVAITGGTADVSTVQVVNGLGLGQAANTAYYLNIAHNKASKTHSIVQQAFGSDANANAMILLNVAGSPVGTISYTGTATAFNTSSDARLKHAVTPLTGALDVVRRLRPVAFLWKVNDESAEGLLAHELQQLIPHAVTGEPDALNDDGSINPQVVDYSKLVPRLVGAIQELLARVEALEARLA